jgi:hypothetical protein
MRVISAVLAGAFLAAAAAWAGDDQTNAAGKPEASTPAPQTKTAAAQDPGDQVVCMEYGQGASRIPGKKVCHTRRVWDQLTQNAREDTESLQRSSQFSAPLP